MKFAQIRYAGITYFLGGQPYEPELFIGPVEVEPLTMENVARIAFESGVTKVDLLELMKRAHQDNAP